jgi:hypothetical protein
MTAAVIMQLAQEGKLGLNDSVTKYVADVPNGANITIAELLEMRSGLYNYTNAPEVAESLDSDPSKVWSAAQVLAIAFSAPPTLLLVQNTSTAIPLLSKLAGLRWAKRGFSRPFGRLARGRRVTPPENAVPISQRPAPLAEAAAPGGAWQMGHPARSTDRDT